jgi:hypothetical protein
VALELVRVHADEAAGEPVRHLSFAAAGHGESDLAARSQEILRAELGRQAP